MKPRSALSLFASMAMVFAESLFAAAPANDNPKVVASRSETRGDVATPHFKPSGRPISAGRGEQVFLDHCALCHGLLGKGDGPRSAFFQPGVQYIPDLTVADFLKGRDAQLLENIRQGLRRFPEPAYVMPQFKYILSDEEIRSALAYVKTLPMKAQRH